MTARRQSMLLILLTLFGAFAFAFVTTEAVHEAGHYLMHRIYGARVGIHLDPFGSSRIVGGGASSAPMGPTSLAGPLFSLLVSAAILAVLWHWRRPLLLPLLLMFPVAMVQEGVTFSLGLLTPGGDASFIVAWGVPAPVLVLLGAFLLICGVAWLALLLPLAGLSRDAGFGTRWLVTVISMVAFMALRLIVSVSFRSGDVTEGVVPLLFAVLLSLAAAGAFTPMQRWLGDKLGFVPWATARTAAVCFGCAAGMIALQLLLPGAGAIT